MPSVIPRTRRVAAILAFGLLPSLLVAGPARAAAPAAAREGVVEGADSPDAIPGRYLVVLKDPRGAAASAQSLVGDGVTTTFGGLAVFSARLSAPQARRLAADPAVRLVEQDRRVHIEADTQRGPGWGLDRIDQRAAKPSKTYTPSDDGSAVHAYVIDTGIRVAHREFGARASYGYDFIDFDGKAADCNGHGTHVAGIIGGVHYGVAKRVQLIAVRVLDCSGSGDIESVVAGVNWVTENAVHPAVANLSLGATHSAVLDHAVRASIASGVTYTVAAGNENDDAAAHSPGDVSTAITVGATDARDWRAAFSNWGSDVDLFAPGVGIRSAYSKSNTSTAIMSGTSMAAPYVAGAAALVLDSNPSWSPKRVRDFLVGGATRGRVTQRGSRSPNRLLFVAAPPASTTIRTTALPAATSGTAYRVQLALGTARRGSWAVAQGRLPAGLTLSAGGLLAGKPTDALAHRFTITFTDYVPQRTSRTYTLAARVTPPVIATTSERRA